MFPQPIKTNKFQIQHMQEQVILVDLGYRRRWKGEVSRIQCLGDAAGKVSRSTPSAVSWYSA